MRIIISPAKKMRVDTDTFPAHELPVFMEKTEILKGWISGLSYSEQKQLFADGYRLKAGITSYRFAPQTEGSTKADVWYFRNWGFWLDIRIMLQRIGTLLSKSKAKSIQYI